MRTGARVGDLTALRSGLGHRSWAVDRDAAAVGRAIDRFRAGSSSYVPHLPPHHARGDGLARRIDALAERVEATRDALVLADRWVGRRALDAVVRLEGDRQEAVHGLHGATGTWSPFRRAVLDLDHPQAWDHAQLRAALRSDLRPDTDEVRALRQLLNAENAAIRTGLDRIDTWNRDWSQRQALAGLWRDTQADLGRIAGRTARTAPGARPVGATTGRLGRLAAAGADSRLGAVVRLGGRGVAVVGVVDGAIGAVQGVRERDGERAMTGGLTAAAGIAMAIPVPPVQLAGALVAGGLLVYEYRDEIAGAGPALAGHLRDRVRQEVDNMRTVVDVGRRLAGTIGDAARGLF